ncbi:hypothetical protein IW262DRAFT_145117 [Armillaria fumosa]|nr:hypothetical protein IW262DRAFT_145117 [Armillaria fumosa]
MGISKHAHLLAIQISSALLFPLFFITFTSTQSLCTSTESNTIPALMELWARELFTCTRMMLDIERSSQFSKER